MNGCAPPLFSVIVPLEFHRGHWERCLLTWQAQTMAKSQFEVILVMPPNFPAIARDKLAVLLGPQDRIQYSNEIHDVGLCAVGAAVARGTFLFFTESHCWPEPDVLEKCLKRFTIESDLAAFSCQSIPVIHNRLSAVEADMYQSDIEFGMTVHPWRKILDQCFVTRRDAYDKCGGFSSELGHFSEWVLSANYFALGYKIGYEPDARFYHYYIGNLAELRKFTRDFVMGECRFFSRRVPAPGAYLIDVPPEWIGQGNSNRRLARSLLRITIQYWLGTWKAKRHRKNAMKIIARWLSPAIFGMQSSGMAAVLRVMWTLATVRGANLIGSNASLARAFKAHIFALIHHQRLASIMNEGGRRRRMDDQAETARNSTWDPFAAGNAGFYPIETYHGVAFRWSQTAAIMPAWTAAGRHRIRVEYLPVRALEDDAALKFFFNERPIDDKDVLILPNSVEFTIDMPRSGFATLAWICLPFFPADDPRQLGIPVIRILCRALRSSVETAPQLQADDLLATTRTAHAAFQA
jgi:hypothetical protein